MSVLFQQMPARKTTNKPSESEYSELFFETPAKWRDWLEQNHSNVWDMAKVL